MDKTKLIEVEAQKREAFMEEVTETREKLKARIQQEEERKQLKD